LGGSLPSKEKVFDFSPVENFFFVVLGLVTLMPKKV